MEMKNLQFRLINPIEHTPRVLDLLQQLNPTMDIKYMESTLHKMANMSNYRCFGLFDADNLIGISSGWTTVRIYCGKQLELDNVIIDSNIQSKGYGKFFMEAITDWSLQHHYQNIGLNTRVQNSRSHKFYFNEGFTILGFHFEKIPLHIKKEINISKA